MKLGSKVNILPLSEGSFKMIGRVVSYSVFPDGTQFKVRYFLNQEPVECYFFQDELEVIK